jgi:hypothetical protein
MHQQRVEREVGHTAAESGVSRWATVDKMWWGEWATRVIENLGSVGQVAAERGEEAGPHGGRVWWG